MYALWTSVGTEVDLERSVSLSLSHRPSNYEDDHRRLKSRYIFHAQLGRIGLLVR